MSARQRPPDASPLPPLLRRLAEAHAATSSALDSWEKSRALRAMIDRREIFDDFGPYGVELYDAGLRATTRRYVDDNGNARFSYSWSPDLERRPRGPKGPPF